MRGGIGIASCPIVHHSPLAVLGNPGTVSIHIAQTAASLLIPATASASVQLHGSSIVLGHAEAVGVHTA